MTVDKVEKYIRVAQYLFEIAESAVGLYHEFIEEGRDDDDLAGKFNAAFKVAKEKKDGDRERSQ